VLRRLLAGHSHEALNCALVALLIPDDWTSVNSVCWIAAERVLATPWNGYRLARCREQLAQGEAAPPIKVVGLRYAGDTLYTLEDGTHRTVAAREAGRRVEACISGYRRIEPPHAFMMRHDALWRCKRPGVWQLAAEPQSGAILAVWAAFGIETLDSAAAPGGSRPQTEETR
jgi:uncharacterized ParB-like nuclease family protein